MRQTLLIGSYLHEDLVAKIAREVPEVEIINRPDLLPEPQFPCDHWGVKRHLSAAQIGEWQECLARAELMFDFDWWNPSQWRRYSPKLKWIQATQAGVGARATGLGHVDNQVQITTAAGVHAKPLAEFALAGLLHFVRQVPALEEMKASQHWTVGPSNTLFGQTALIIGAGSIGREIAETLDYFGVTCDGTSRNARQLGAPFRNSIPLAECDLGTYEIIVLSCPLTDETKGMFSKRMFSSMKQHSYIVNLSRGAVVDQTALIEALETGWLAGAVLDVADPEPLPEGHPLWTAPNLVLSPHTAANVDAENARIVDLFIDNLRRYFSGGELANSFVPSRGY